MAYNLLSAGNQTNPKRVYRHDGIAAATTGFMETNDPSGTGMSISGLAWDGENIIVARPAATGGFSARFQRYIGFSSTLDSEVLLSYNAQGIAWDRVNGYLLSVEPDTDTIRRYDGFSSTVINSLVITDAEQIALDSDGNLIVWTWTSSGGRVRRYDGFSTTQTASFSHGGVGRGLVWDDQNGNLISGLPGSGATNDDIYVHDGFSATILSTLASPDNDLAGLALEFPPLTAEKEGWGMLI